MILSYIAWVVPFIECNEIAYFELLRGEAIALMLGDEGTVKGY